MTTLTVTDQQLDTLRKAVLYDLHELLGSFTSNVHQLSEQADLAEGTLAADTASSAKIVRQYLDALDALGWSGAEQEATQ